MNADPIRVHTSGISDGAAVRFSPEKKKPGEDDGSPPQLISDGFCESTAPEIKKPRSKSPGGSDSHTRGAAGDAPVQTEPHRLPEIPGKSAPESVRTNTNGTITVLSPPPPGTSSEEVNFARLYGVETSPAGDRPQHFTRDAVEQLYFTGGRPEDGAPPSDAGKELYGVIKSTLLDPVPQCPYGSPSLYFTGGLPGSGKGYVLRKMAEGPTPGGHMPQFVHVDPDEIKKYLLSDFAARNPQVREEMSRTPGWNDMIHESASALAKQLMSDALASGKDIVFDSSMASTNVEKYRKYARVARDKGYRIYGLINEVSEETAQERAVKRAKKPMELTLPDGETLALPGRLLQPRYIHECALNLQTNVDTYLGEGLFDRCVIFDGTSRDTPVKASLERVQNPDGSFTSRTSTP